MISWEQLGNINILIVEDDPFNRLLIRTMLSKIPQVNFYESHDGLEALEDLKSHDIDIILLDLHMPNMDGYQTLIEVKKEPKYKAIAILAMTTDEEEKKRFYQQGADEFIAKPFKIEELEAKIYTTLKEKKVLKPKSSPSIKEQIATLKSKLKQPPKTYTLEEIEISQKDFFLKFISAKTKSHPLERQKIKIISSLSKTFALKLGLSKSHATNIYYATLIRDIGLCGLSESDIISAKNDPKAYHQYILMGYQIIANSIDTDFIKIAKKTILQYQEFYDGTGIPYGLKQFEISDEAMIIAIIEMFEKLLGEVSHNQEEVYNLLYAQSTKRFNPRLITIFLENFSEFIQLRKKLLNL